MNPADGAPSDSSPQTASRMRRFQEAVDASLDLLLPQAHQPPKVIHQAIRYSIFAGGKRLRPILAMATGEALSGPSEPIMRLACAIEMIHTFSLVHDDLPAMDDDDFRRGKPTLHREYGEAVAVLAGDALMNLAFQTLSSPQNAGNPQRSVEVIHRLCLATGTAQGMIGGQVFDMQTQGRPFDRGTLETIHASKTGALIAASVECAALICEAGPEEVDRLGAYGRSIGLAFQIVDDILDVEGTAREMGKNSGKDKDQRKATYPALYGLERSRREAQRLVGEAIDHIGFLGERGRFLEELACFVSVRRF